MNNSTAELLSLLATGGRHPKVAEIIAAITAGADIHAKNDNGLDALQLLLTCYMPGIGNIPFYDVFDALMQAGARLDTRTPAGESLQDLAARLDDNSHSLQALDREAFRRADPVLHANIPRVAIGWPQPGTPVTDDLRRNAFEELSSDRYHNAFYYLHLFPEATNWQDSQGRTALMQQIHILQFANSPPIQPERLKVINLLITRSQTIDQQDRDGRTALMQAVTAGFASETLIPALIEAGANPQLRDYSGNSAQTMAQLPDYSAARIQLDQALTDKKERARQAAALRHAEQHRRNTDLLSDRRRQKLRL